MLLPDNMAKRARQFALLSRLSIKSHTVKMRIFQMMFALPRLSAKFQAVKKQECLLPLSF